MSADELSISDLRVTEVTKAFPKGSKDWFPFKKTQGMFKHDKVVYVVAARKEDLLTGEISYEWTLRLNGGMTAQMRSFNSSWPNIHMLQLDLGPLEEIFETLAWDTSSLRPQEKVKVN